MEEKERSGRYETESRMTAGKEYNEFMKKY